MPILSLPGTRPKTLGVHDGQLAACPASPNCVSSDSEDAGHSIAAIALAGGAGEETWNAVRATVAGMPRTRIVTETADYLHAECQSQLLGFVDDLELHLRPDLQQIAVRSASRLGYGDLGVNRRRVEGLRKALVALGIAR